MQATRWIPGCLVLVLTSALVAQNVPPPGGPGGRGARTPGQMQEMMKAAWEKVDKEACHAALDSDGDGTVSKEEFDKSDLNAILGKALNEAMQKVREERRAAGDQAQGQGRENAMQRMDKNGDGIITADEFPRGAEAFERLLQRGDKNGDKGLDADELAAIREQGGGGSRGGGGNRGDGNR